MPSIEEHIQKAIEEGKFDHLPGQGKPLRLEENPHEDPEWRAANHLLKSNGFTPPWIAERQVIEAGLQQARQELSRAWRWRQEQGARRPAGEVEAEWRRAVERFQEQVTKINRGIFNYNLMAPDLQFHLKLIKAEQEIASITGIQP